MKTNRLNSLAIAAIVLILCYSCKPSLSVRSKIKHHEEALCNYPETYTSSFKWVVRNDSLLTPSKVSDTALNQLDDSYEPVKIIYHSFTAKDARGILSKDTSKTILSMDGRLKFE